MRCTTLSIAFVAILSARAVGAVTVGTAPDVGDTGFRSNDAVLRLARSGSAERTTDVERSGVDARAVTDDAGTPRVTAPVPSGTLDSERPRLVWTAGSTGVRQWWVRAGSRVTGRDYFDSGRITDAGARSVLLDGLPSDGSTVHVELNYKLLSGRWAAERYTYTAFSSAGGTTDGSTDGTTDGSSTEGGTTDGDTTGGGSTDGGESGAATDGSGAGGGGSTDAGTGGESTTGGGGGVSTPAVASPSPGSVISGTAQTITWVTNGTAVRQWWVRAGGAVGGRELFDSGRITDASTRSVRLTGLPADGTTVHVELNYKLASGQWSASRYTYSAAGAGGGATTGSSTGEADGSADGSSGGSDAAGSTSSGTTDGTGTTGGTDGGTADGATDGSGSDGTGTTDGTGGDTSGGTDGSGDGATDGGGTTGSGPPSGPALLSPRPGDTLSGGSQTFTWATNGTSVRQWWLRAGSSPGARDLFDSGRITNASTRRLDVSGLPTDGSTVHVTFFHKLANGSWESEAVTFEAAGGADGGTDGAEADTPPVANAGADVRITLGASVTVDGSGSIDDGDAALAYRWRDATGSLLGEEATLTFVPAAAGSLVLTLTVTDSSSASDDDEVTVTVAEPANTPPLADAGPDASVELGETVTLDGSASVDFDDGIAAFIWRDPSGEVLEDTASFDYTPESAGVFTLTLDVVDTAGQRASDTVVLTVTEPPPVIRPFPYLADYELAFEDDFDGNALDPNKWYTGFLWGPYLSINNEEQLYVDTLGMHSAERGGDRDPFEVSGGTLKITATPTTSELQPPPRPPRDDAEWTRELSTYNYGDPVGTPGEPGYRPGYDPDEVDYLSGLITSYKSFKSTHGYFEMRAKIPAGRGLWPAFWMLPTHYVESVPEIDIMEFLGQDVDRLYHTYHHFDIADNWRLVSTPSYRSNAEDWTRDFHTFGMSWSPREISFYVDGVLARTVRDSEYRISNQAMYLLANLAVGGDWPGAPDASTPFPATFEIDYIRAYEKKLSSTLDLAGDYQLMFADEFDGNGLDPDKWKSHFIWGPYLPINGEAQYYVDALDSDGDLGYSPFTVADGVLSITARTADDPDGTAPPAELPGLNDPIWTDHPTFRRNESYEPPDFTSGIITSYDSFRFVQGYAEIRAKLPAGKGLWPAFWLLNRYYVGELPEIDVLETRGERPREVTHAFHRNRRDGTTASDVFESVGGDAVEGFSDGFHTFGVRWRPGSLTWYIDGQPVKTYTGDDVSYQLMYVIANLAVGGSFPDVPDDPSVFPASYDIDYIRVYQEKDPG